MRALRGALADPTGPASGPRRPAHVATLALGVALALALALLALALPALRRPPDPVGAPTPANTAYLPGVRVTTIAGGASPGHLDGPAQQARFTEPVALARGADGTIYIGEAGGRLRALQRDGTVITLSTLGLAESEGGTAGRPRGLALAPTGELLFTEERLVPRREYMLRSLTLSGGVSTLLGSPAGDRDGPAASAQVGQLGKLAVAPDGTIYLADSLNHRVRALRPDGTLVTVAGTGLPGDRDGPANAAQFVAPWGIALDREGRLYVAELLGGRVRVIEPGGTVRTLAGTGVAGHRDGPAAQARFAAPSALAPADDGTLYLAEGSAAGASGHRIRAITPDGLVRTVAGDGTPGYADGPGASARFNTPADLLVDTDGSLIVADSRNHRLRRITIAADRASLSLLALPPIPRGALGLFVAGLALAAVALAYLTLLRLARAWAR